MNKDYVEAYDKVIFFLNQLDGIITKPTFHLAALPLHRWNCIVGSSKEEIFPLNPPSVNIIRFCKLPGNISKIFLERSKLAALKLNNTRSVLGCLGTLRHNENFRVS